MPIKKCVSGFDYLYLLSLKARILDLPDIAFKFILLSSCSLSEIYTAYDVSIK